MKTALIISALFAACYAFFATAKMLPNWVHELNGRGYDKHFHCAMFFVLQIVCCLVFPKIPPLSIAAVLVVVGVGVEIGQSFIGRNFCTMDIFSDMAGILAAILFLHFFNYFR